MASLLQYIILVKIICIYAVNALIGLRPPSGVPHYLRTQNKRQDPATNTYSDTVYKNLHMHSKTDAPIKDPLLDPFATQSLNKFILQRTYQNHTVSNKVLEKVQAIQDKVSNTNHGVKASKGHVILNRNNAKCRPIAVNRCGIQFLKRFLHNTNSSCEMIQDLERCLLDRLGDLDDKNVHYLLNNIRNVKTSTSSCPAVPHDFYGYRKITDQLALCEENMLQCTFLTYRALIVDTRSCEPLSQFTSCIARAIGYKSDKTASKIFNSIMSLTRTCVHARFPL